jgi:hypothetical protein
MGSELVCCCGSTRPTHSLLPLKGLRGSYKWASLLFCADAASALVSDAVRSMELHGLYFVACWHLEDDATDWSAQFHGVGQCVLVGVRTNGHQHWC